MVVTLPTRMLMLMFRVTATSMVMAWYGTVWCIKVWHGLLSGQVFYGMVWLKNMAWSGVV